MSTAITLERNWEGLVRIDPTFDNYVTNVQELGTAKQLTIKDMKYQHSIDAMINGVANWNELDKAIHISIEGNDIQPAMRCTAGIVNQNIEKTKGIFKKATYTEKVPVGYGIKLEPVSEIKEKLEELPCLASYHARIGRDNSFRVHNRGHIAFFSGSQSAMYSNTSAYFSITTVFVSSDKNPFTATVRKKGKTYKMLCKNSGIEETSEDFEEILPDSKENKPKKSNDPLQILKMRLAKGEITIEEFEKLKNALG
jgi:hypothetical protein